MSTTTTTSTSSSPAEEYPNTRKNFRTRVGDILINKVNKFEEILKKSSSGFLFGDSVTIADLKLFCTSRFFDKDILDHVGSKEILSNTTAVKAHFKKISALESVSAWYKEEHKADVSLEKKGLELVYFNIEGRAEPIRLALRMGGVDFKDVRVDRDTFKKMKEDGTLPYGQVPLLLVDGVPVAQSASILRYAARLGKCPSLYPKDDFQAGQVDALVDLLEELAGPLGPVIHPERYGIELDNPDATPPSVGNNSKGSVKNRLGPIKLDDIESILSKSSSGYAVGDNLTIADLHLCCAMQFVTSRAPTVLNTCPKVKEHMEKISSLDAVSKWQSQEHKAWDGSDLEGKGFELVSFNTPALAEAIRLTCQEGSVNFKDVRLDRETQKKWKAKGLFPQGKLPVLFVDGAALIESEAILRYFGKRAGLYPSDPLQAAQVDSFINGVQDSWKKHAFLHHGFPGLKWDCPNKKSLVQARLGGRIVSQLEIFDNILKKSTSGFLVGDSVTIADFAFMGLIGLLDTNMKPVLANAPYSTAHFKKISALESVAAWNQEDHKVGEVVEKKGLELVYFDIPGRAEPIRLTLKEGGLTFKDVRLGFGSDEYKKMKGDGILPFGQVPVLFNNGEPVNQSKNILRYVAKLSNSTTLYPSDPLVAAEVDAFVVQVNDILNPITVTMFPGQHGWVFDDPDAEKPTYGANTKKAVRTRLIPIIQKGLTQIEAILAQNSSGYLVGDSLTIADINLFCMVQYFNKDILDHIDCKALIEKVPKIKAHWQKMLSLDSIANWYKEEQKGDGMELKKEGLELVYFPAAGRAEPIRLALKHGSIAFRDLRVDKDTFKKMKEENILPFGQLPVLFIDGKPLAQSMPILRYAGIKANLYPTDPHVAAKVDAIMDNLADIGDPVNLSMYPQKAGFVLEK